MVPFKKKIYPCKHEFHEKCIDMHYSHCINNLKLPDCPLCRGKSDNTIKKVGHDLPISMKI